MLMSHLDDNSRKDAQIKASIVEILSVTVLITAGGSIGKRSGLWHIDLKDNGHLILIVLL